MSRKRTRYDDKFRASAVVMLEAAGYPGREGALTQVASHLGIPRQTLQRWGTGARNPAPPELVTEKKAELLDLLNAELDGIFKAMPGARDTASYRDLGTVAGILIDKRQLLTGQPTWRVEVIDLLKAGVVTPEEVMNDLGPDIAQELFEQAGLHLAGIRPAETESQPANS